MNTMNLSRRTVMAGGALLVGFRLAPALAADATNEGDLKVAPALDSWVRISPDGDITVLTGKAELGQGISTAIIQVAAEELDVRPERIMLITADTGRTPNEGYTAGSHSMDDSGTAVRDAAACVRALLMQAAALRWGVPPGRLQTTDGVVLGIGRAAGHIWIVGRRGRSASAGSGPPAAQAGLRLHARGPVDAARGYSRQTDRNPELRAGHATAGDAARPGGTADRLRRRPAGGR